MPTEEELYSREGGALDWRVSNTSSVPDATDGNARIGDKVILKRTREAGVVVNRLLSVEGTGLWYKVFIIHNQTLRRGINGRDLTVFPADSEYTFGHNGDQGWEAPPNTRQGVGKRTRAR